MQNPLVSFVVPAYNTEPYVADCLNGIFSQRTITDFEVILIDDASVDGTADVVKSFTDPRLRFIKREKNLGAIATANEAFGLARGEFIAGIDSDDRHHPGFLEKTIPILQANPDVGMVYTNIATIDPKGVATVPRVEIPRMGRPAKGNEFFPLLELNYIPAPATVTRSKALKPLLPAPSDYRFLDWYFTTGIAERWDSVYVDEVLADYRIHPHNMHHKMILDRTGEATTFRVLHKLFANSFRQQEKKHWRHRVYASNYLVYADKYFGCEMNADARRCYLQAIKFERKLLWRGGVLRRLLATFISRRIYESSKRLVRTRRD